MTFRRSASLIGCWLLLATLLASTAVASRTDIAAAWRDYAARDMSRDPAYRFPHADCFAAASRAHALPETLLLAVARGESDFEATARSRANAHGVMQILWPDTAHHLGIRRLSDLYDPCTNIDAGARYLKELLARYEGDLHLSLAAYNYGPGRINSDGTDVPAGALWYSRYIYRHLNYVLGRSPGHHPVPDTLYSDVGQSTLVTFGEPYRAEAFIERLEAQAPSLNLDWFRRDTGRFEVVMTYAGREEFEQGARQLQRAGFRLD